MDYWQRRKLVKLVVIAVLVIGAIWGIRELLRPHASLVTIKYVEDLETFQRSPKMGGYTRAVSTEDKQMVQEWIRFLEEIGKCGESEAGYLDQPFPCYIVEYRMGTSVWTAMLQVTENRAGRSYQFFGGEVLELDADKDFFGRAGELMAKTEAQKKGATLLDSGELSNGTGLDTRWELNRSSGKYVELLVENKGENSVVAAINGQDEQTLQPGETGKLCVEVTQDALGGDREYLFRVVCGTNGGAVNIRYEITQRDTQG